MRVVGVMAMLLLATPVDAQRQSLRQETEALMTAMVSAFKADPASVAKFYTDDARILGGGQRSIGREQIDAYWRDATMFADWKLEVLEVGEGAMPWVRGRSTLHGKSGRTMVTEFLGLLKRGADGKLRFYVDMFVMEPPGTRAAMSHMASPERVVLRDSAVTIPLRKIRDWHRGGGHDS